MSVNYFDVLGIKACFQDLGEAVAIGPSMPRSAESHVPIEMSKLVELVALMQARPRPDRII